MNGLALFAGICGIEIGLGKWVRTICYIENEPYCVEVIKARIRDGLLDDAPIWDDVRTFDGRPWRGLVDIVTGGFPCQDVSVAGRGEGIEGSRSGLWYEMARIVREVRPRYVFIENVPGLFSTKSEHHECVCGWFGRQKGTDSDFGKLLCPACGKFLDDESVRFVRGIETVFGDLAAIGYDIVWTCLQAAEVGAPHRRKRVFILAYAPNIRCELWRSLGEGIQREDETRDETIKCSDSVAHARRKPERHKETRNPIEESQRGTSDRLRRRSKDVAYASQFAQRKQTDKANAEPGKGYTWSESSDGSWWDVEPDVGRVAHGVPFELDCIRGLNDCSNDKKEKSKRDRLIWSFLCKVWEYREFAETSPRLYKSRLQSLVPEMSYRDTYDGWYVGARIKTDKELRDLWETFYSQPFQKAQNMQSGLLERIRKTKRPQALVSRVDRLKALGNAVVPQQAETAFKILWEMMINQRKDELNW